MKIKLVLFGIFLLALVNVNAQAPRIVYSEPEKEDSRRTSFEILGKLSGDLLVYKNNRSEHAISIYDDEMKSKNKVVLDFMPDRVINVDYISFADKVLFFYQYQRRRIVYCDYIAIGANGRPLGNPVTLDTTEIGYTSSNKIYTVINSDDKQKIMLFKVNSSNPRKFFITSFLYDTNLSLITRNFSQIDMDEKGDYFSDFHLSNAGELVVAKFSRAGNTDFISGVSMLVKHPDSLGFNIRNVEIGKQILDNLLMKIDNNNNRVLLASFFSRQKRGNIEGLYLVNWDKTTNSKVMDTAIVFNDELRVMAKGTDANKKSSFNDFFIKNIFIRKDGGFVIVSESLYTTSRNNSFNRWDYMGWGNPWYGPMNYGYWSPMYSPYGMPWNRYGWNNSMQNRYFAENVLVLSFGQDGTREWSNVITKNQFDDESDNLISYGIMNTGGEVHFLFNTFERRTYVLTDQSLDPTGKITRYPTLKNLDKGYDFMPRFAKQVSARQIIIPCLYRNYLCFASVDF